jgi:hypothetical protein
MRVRIQRASKAGMAGSVKRSSFNLTPVAECINALPIKSRMARVADDLSADHEAILLADAGFVLT